MIGSGRFGFCMFLLAVSAGIQAQPVDASRVRDLSGLVMMMGPLQTMRDACANLFPAQATVIRGLYDASAVPAYAKLFGYEVKSPPPLDRDRELESLGMSESEASDWCFTDFPTTLDQFERTVRKSGSGDEGGVGWCREGANSETVDARRNPSHRRSLQSSQQPVRANRRSIESCIRDRRLVGFRRSLRAGDIRLLGSGSRRAPVRLFVDCTALSQGDVQGHQVHHISDRRAVRFYESAHRTHLMEVRTNSAARAGVAAWKRGSDGRVTISI